MNAEIRFIEKTEGPKNMVAEAEIEFTDGILKGTKLVGFTVWNTDLKGKDFIVTLPSRSWGGPGEKRFFDLVRAGDGGTDALKAARKSIIDAFNAWRSR